MGDASEKAANGNTNGAETASEPRGSMLAYRAPHLLQPHFARKALADAHAGVIPPLIGFYCGLPSTAVSKIAAQLGADLVWVDWEHAAMSHETMTQMAQDIQLVSEGRSHAIVRIPGHGHENIGFALDAGASIVVPQVNTVEEARHIVAAAKFGASLPGTNPPLAGTRSAPPGRWMPGYSDACADASKTLWQNLNEQAAIIIQIESLQGIRNLDAILASVGPYIDSVWLGTLDCRVSMGLPGLFGNEPEWLAALRTYNAALKKHDQACSGLAFGTPEQVRKGAVGKSFLVPTGDIFSLTGLGAVLAETKAAFPAQDKRLVYQEAF